MSPQACKTKLKHCQGMVTRPRWAVVRMNANINGALESQIETRSALVPRAAKTRRLLFSGSAMLFLCLRRPSGAGRAAGQMKCRLLLLPEHHRPKTNLQESLFQISAVSLNTSTCTRCLYIPCAPSVLSCLSDLHRRRLLGALLHPPLPCRVLPHRTRLCAGFVPLHAVDSQISCSAVVVILCFHLQEV